VSLVSPRVIRGNRGDIASRYGILQTLLSGGTPVSAVFAARDAHIPEPLRHLVLPYGSLYNFWPRLRGLRALLEARTVIWTGGLDLQDDSSLIKLVHTLLVFASYRCLGLKLLVALQGAGPLTTRPGRWLARTILALTHLVLVRDRGSLRLLGEIMPKGRLRLAADGIFLPGFPRRGDGAGLPPAIEAICTTGGRPLIGLNVRLWFHFASSLIPYQFRREHYLRRAEAPMEVLLSSMAEIVGELRRRHNARVVLVSMYEPGSEPWEDDAPLLEKLKARFRDDPEVVMMIEDLSILELCAMFARFDLMIGTRLHATLIALRAGVPALHIAYTLKGRDIYADLGLADWAVEIEEVMRSGQIVIEKAAAILADPQRFERVQAVIEPLVAENARLLLQAVRTVERG
jgi:polysaccharide pyruvyl transferase WcaK-like protein